MASIEKLLVQGIRSFDPKEASVIDFYTPLTLIVGQNGAGKTTIIECLKYTCTGEMPPNCSNGQAFIHDTKIAGESEVKAQIKLRFKNPIGKPIVASRSLSLVQKSKNKQEYKQIDASLQSYTSDGQKVSKSFRCSDMDKEIPDLMGVAKPILKHVIFCHQEDSNWPLSESSKLKIKFDEIFSAVKYTKALKSLKEKRKILTTTVKELKLKLETVSANIEHSNRIKKELARMEDQFSTGNKSLEEIKISLLEKQKTLTTIKGAELKLQELKNDISVLNARKLEMERVKNQLFTSLTEVFQDESDEALVFMQSEFNKECDTMSAAERELSENSEKLLLEKEQINHRLKENSSSIGRLQSMISQQQSIQTDRDKQIKDLVTRYKMLEYSQSPIPYENTVVEKFISEITSKFEQLSSSINSFSKSNKQKLTTIQNKSNQLRAELNQKIALSDEKQFNITTNIKKSESIDLEIQQHTLSADKIDSLEIDIQSKESELSSIQSDALIQETEQSLSNLNKEKLEIENSIIKLRNTLKLLNLQAGSRTRLNIKRNEIQQKLNQISLKFNQTLTTSDGDGITFLFLIKSLFGGEGLDDDSFKNQIILNHKLLLSSNSNDKIITINNQLTSLKQENTLLIDKKNQIDAQLNSSIKPQIEKKQQELKSYQSLIESSGLFNNNDNVTTITTITFEEKRDQIKNLLEKCKKSYIVLESEDILYKEYIEKANLEKECSLCKNDMNGNELESFVHTLESHCNDIPNKMSKLSIEITDLKSKLEQFEKLAPIIVNREQILEKILPELQDREQSLSSQQSELLGMLESLQTLKLKPLDHQLKQLQSISLLFQFIDSIKQSIIQVDNEIQKEEQEIRKQSSDLRTIEEVDSSIEKEQQQLDKVNNDIKSWSDKLKKDQNLIYQKQSVLIDLKNQLTTFKSASGIIDHLRDGKKELQSKNQQLQLDIQSLQQSIQDTRQSIDQFEKELQQTESEFEKKMETYTKERNTFSIRLEAINSLQFKMISINGGGGGNNTTLLEQLSLIEIENQQLEILLQTITQDYINGQDHIAAIQKNLSNKDITKRAITDNIAYRQQQINVDQMVRQIARKNELIKEMVQSQLEIDSNKLNLEINSLKSRFDQITGQTGVLRSQIASNRLELSKPTYKNIDETYRDLLIHLSTTETIGKDLDKYYKALDKALMKYHNLKMDEINRSIKEIWQTTYKGNDIDTIEIRSEETGTANKTLNYRVVMIKGEVELDMRGRCSAGQKVLACLVIRLALAENFCANCGILALDEPTSHLDRANIESFANSLLNIIESRKTQKGFQLIIITHDEELVNLLSRGNYCDYVWKITKNANQHSHIERKEIADI